MKHGTAWLWSFGLLMLPGTALAAWGENWGEMVWGLPVSVPSVPGIGLIALAFAISGTAAWTLRSRRSAVSLPVLLVLLAIPLVVAAGTVTVPNTFTNNTTADASEVNANFDAVETAVNHNDSRITAVETAATAAQGTADAAQASANAAQTSANAAQTSANAAQTSANAAQASADAAQASADAAQGTAAAAQTSAAAAQTSAEAAQGTADAAATSAAAAATAASNAQGSADSAQAAINGHLSPGCTANYALATSACPFPGSDLAGYNKLSNCADAPTDSLCEGDGECGTDVDLDNCPSGYDVYYKTDAS